MTNLTREPAFPRDHRYDGHNGMSLRDYFAAKAMAALIIAPITDWPECALTEDTNSVSKVAYALADEMLKERAK